MAIMLPIYLASVYYPFYLSIVTLAISNSAFIYLVVFRSLFYIYFPLDRVKSHTKVNSNFATEMLGFLLLVLESQTIVW